MSAGRTVLPVEQRLHWWRLSRLPVLRSRAGVPRVLAERQDSAEREVAYQRITTTVYDPRGAGVGGPPLPQTAANMRLAAASLASPLRGGRSPRTCRGRIVLQSCMAACTSFAFAWHPPAHDPGQQGQSPAHHRAIARHACAWVVPTYRPRCNPYQGRSWLPPS